MNWKKNYDWVVVGQFVNSWKKNFSISKKSRNTSAYKIVYRKKIYSNHWADLQL